MIKTLSEIWEQLDAIQDRIIEERRKWPRESEQFCLLDDCEAFIADAKQKLEEMEDCCL